MSKTALLVIDAQESFRTKDWWSADHVAPYLAKQQALIDGAKAKGLPIVRILHAGGDGPFSLESGLVRTLDELAIEPDVTFVKARHSAFAGTPLSIWLRERGIDRIIVSGIRTEQCCETTSRHGSDLGFKVDFVTEATLTSDMATLGGDALPALDIMKRTEAVLQDRFATVRSVEESLAA